MPMRFNHMELTFAPGTLDEKRRAEITAFYTDVFGWEASTVPILKQEGLLLKIDPEVSQFILLIENRNPMQPPAYDHLGLLMDTREEVDEILERCKAWQARDDRVELKIYDDLVNPTSVVHAFYVRYLLPIHFDVQVIERSAGNQPAREWRYVAT